MTRVLLAVDDPRDARYAVRHVIAEFTTNTTFEFHILNVQPRLRRHIAQFVCRENRESFYRDEAEKALRPVLRMLDGARMPYSVHMKVGPKALTIAATASRLGCDRIVIAAARKNVLARMLENSVADSLPELTPIPIVLIAGRRASMAERYGVPATAGALLALLLFAAVE
jgi:nucleotide-binding universal stress UspA family protein